MAFEVPLDFVYPSPEEQLAGTLRGIGEVLPVASIPIEDGGILSPGVSTFVGAVAGSIQDIAEIPIGQLVNLGFNVAALGQATDALGVVNATAQLLDASVEVVVEVAEAVGAASDIVSVIPLVGQAIGMVLGIVGIWAKSENVGAQLAEKCREWAAQQHNGFCQKIVQDSKIVSSGGYSPNPSDLFRQMAYVRQKNVRGNVVGQPSYGKRLWPANASSVYLALCGGQAGDFSIVTENEYQRIAKYLGIRGSEPSVRKKMWTLIDGIMNNVQPAEFGVLASRDAGRSLMPVLQDIVRSEMKKGKSFASPWGINEQFIREVSKRILSWTKAVYPCLSGSQLPSTVESCTTSRVAGANTWDRANPRIDLAEPFIAGMKQYDQEILKVEAEAKRQRQAVASHIASVSASQPVLVPSLSGAKKGVLVTSDATNSMLEEIWRGQNRPSTGVITMATLLLTGGAFVGARRLAKR